MPTPPTILVERTVWHPDPKRRVATVELEGHAAPLELREGDSVGVLVVHEVKPSAVVFLMGGEELQRKVGVRD